MVLVEKDDVARLQTVHGSGAAVGVQATRLGEVRPYVRSMCTKCESQKVPPDRLRIRILISNV